MFTRFMSLLVLVTPLVSALTINAPTGVIAGLYFSLSWVTAPDDPTNCALELFSEGTYKLVIVSDVILSSGFITLQCPADVPPSDSYGIQAFVETIAYNGSVTPLFFARSAMFSISSLNGSVFTSSSSRSVSGSSSSSTGTCTVPASTTPSSSPSTTIHIEAIIGGVIGGLVFISLLLVALFFFNRRSQARNDTVPSFDVVNPLTVLSSNPTSTFQSQDYTSNGQSAESLPSQSISRQFMSSNPASTSSSDGFRPLTPLRQQFSPAVISPSSSRLHLTGLQTSLDYVPQAATVPSMRQSPSPRGVIRHEDSGVRISPTEDDVVELPPFYTPG